MTAPAWWEGLAPVETEGPPGAEAHRLVWRDGDLQLAAHPDPDADIAVGALGGAVCPCLDLLDAWMATHLSGSILVVGARNPGEALSRPRAAIDAVAADLARWRGAAAALRADARRDADTVLLDRLAVLSAPAEARAQRRLGSLLLLALDPRLQWRLQGSVAAALAAPGRSAVMSAATAGRAFAPLRALGWSGGLSDIDVGEEAVVGHARVVLPPTWVASVWGRGLASAVEGHLVLEVQSVASDGGCTVLAAAPGKPQVAIGVDRCETV